MIAYFFQDTDFKFENRRFNNRWLKLVAENENRKLGNVNIIFCSDDYVLDVNMKYLKHDYYTDIITFDYCDKNILSGDLFISVDSVKYNSAFYNSGFDEELHRVIVHGLLHLIGYDDHTDDDNKEMRAKENFYLEMRNNLLQGTVF